MVWHALKGALLFMVLSGSISLATALEHAGPPGHSGESPGKSGESPGRSGESPGRGGESPGKSGENPGNSGENPGGSGGSVGAGGNAAAAGGMGYARPDEDIALEAVRSREAVPLDEVLGTLRELTRDRIIDTQLISRRGMLVYEVKVISADGFVRVFRFDAGTGRQVSLD
jgi:hypothetical protein